MFWNAFGLDPNKNKQKNIVKWIAGLTNDNDVLPI